MGLAVVAPLEAAPALAGSFEYLYIEADSGASSGGHAAIRFGDDTYHFAHADPGIIRAMRDRSEDFDYEYRAFDNRGIDVTRVEVSGDTYETLRRSFVRRQLIEDSQLEALASASRDVALFDALAPATNPSSAALRKAAQAGVVLKGGGYFFEPSRAATSSTLPVADAQLSDVLRRVGIATLREVDNDLEREQGAGFSERRRADVDREIRGLRYECSASPSFDAHRVPAAGADFADRYRDLLLARLALDVVATGRAPVTSGFRTSTEPSFALTPQEIEALRARGAQIRRTLIALLASNRADRGFPSLVGLARLIAMETSIALERLVVLDSFDDGGDGDDDEVRGGAELGASLHAANAVLDEQRERLEHEKRGAIGADPASEVAWTRLEVAANLYLELRQRLATGGPIRTHPSPVPARAAALDSAWPTPAAGAVTLEDSRACARDVVRRAQAEVQRLYAYDLTSRNCVTEIFATIDDAFARTPQSPSAAPQATGEVAALGGRVDAERDLNFIPLVSAFAVNRAYRVIERTRLPSYRRYWLRRIGAERGPLRTRLRESNVLTSRLYQHGEPDAFLFFTDDTPLLRPLLGAANLLVGTGSAVAGLFALPFDGGRLAAVGMHGVLFSLPELGFVNIRKGSNVIVPRNWTVTPVYGM